jgi:hypothetical protein
MQMTDAKGEAFGGLPASRAKKYLDPQPHRENLI